jgi:hypothetical protein
MMHCPACGAPLEVPRGTRDLSCPYCRNTSLLEGEDRAVGRALKRFYLACHASEQSAEANWGRVFAVSVDESDRIYICGVIEGVRTLFALDSTLTKLRWANANVGDLDENVQLAARQDRVLVIRKDQPVVAFSASDGKPIGRIPEKASFDAAHLRSFALLEDGTCLISVTGETFGNRRIHSILYRTDLGGTPLPTWGEEYAAPPELGATILDLEKVTSQPMVVRDRIDIIGGFGTEVLVTDADKLVKLRRDGSIATMLDRPRDLSWGFQTIALDGLNRIHALTGTRAYISFDTRNELRLRATRGDGSRVFQGEQRIAAGRSGAVVLVGENGRLRIIRPDGTLGYVSAASAEDDRQSSP